MHYYNEWDTHAAHWLRNLCKAGLIPDGTVDTQDIRILDPETFTGVVQAHFFAGIGGWPYALQLAGWPTTRPVWTASCPCQPFSAAGQRRGQADERHLWPALFRLIRECRPECVVGEQVASAIGHGWLDGISADLEGEGYAVGAVILGAHSVGAPHIRQRLYWVALAESPRRWPNPGTIRSGETVGLRTTQGEEYWGAIRETGWALHCGTTDRVDDPQVPERRGAGVETDPRRRFAEARRPTRANRLDDAAPARGQRLSAERQCGVVDPPGASTLDAWRDYTLLPCRDGKTRRIESGLQPLVDGVPFRLADGRTREGVSRAAVLKGIGNAIVPQVAAAFLRAFLATETP